MMKPSVGRLGGILNRKAGETKFQLCRYAPAADLSFFIERYWTVCWDLAAPYVQETLPHPCVNLAVERGQSGIFGIDTGKSARLIEGKGRVFGVKFKPGAFYPFIKSPVSQFTDCCTSLCAVFGMDGKALEEAVLALNDDAERIAVVEDFLRERLPERDETVTLINEVVDCIVAYREITRVDDLVKRLNLSKRTLQRLFNQYVGVSPKWVIGRYRLHEAVEQLSDGEVLDWARLAVELGYFDQAHFIKDFKTVVGRTPAEYARQVSL